MRKTRVRQKKNKRITRRRSMLVWSREWLAFGLLILLAVTVRVVYLLQYKSSVPYYSVAIVDSEFYDNWAQKVASGAGYGPKPFYLAPFYPYVLGLVYAVFGHSLLAGYVVNMFLGLVNLTLVYFIARRIFGNWSAAAGIGFLILYAPLMYLEPKLLSEVLTITLSLASIALMIKAVGSDGLLWVLCSGLSLGLACIARPITGLFAAMLVIWFVLGQIRARPLFRFNQMTAFLLGLALPIGLVTARNWLIGGDFVPISTNAGVTFAQGNNEQTKGACVVVLPGFTGAIKTQQQEEMEIAAQALGRTVKPSEASRYWFGIGLKFIKDHPYDYLRLLGNKLIWSLHNRESPCSYNFYAERRLVPVLRFLPMPFSLLLGFSVFGMAIAWKSGKETRILILYVICIFCGLLLFFVTSRYRMPAVPVLAIFAGFGLVRAIEMLRAKQIMAIGKPALCAGVAMLASLVPYPMPPITMEAPVNLGISHMMLGQSDKAIAQFREALRINPHYAYAYRCLADAEAQAGNFRDAIRDYKKAIALNPSDHLAHFGLGMAFSQLLRFHDAIAPFEKAVRLSPSNEEAHNNLAVAYFMTGDYDRAWKEVHACMEHGGQPHPEFVRQLSRVMPDPGIEH